MGDKKKALGHDPFTPVSNSEKALDSFLSGPPSVDKKKNDEEKNPFEDFKVFKGFRIMKSREKKLKLLAATLDRDQAGLVEEALDLLFRKYGDK